MSRRRSATPITAYAWLNALGARHVVSPSQELAEWPLGRKALPRINDALSLPGLLAIPGHWGLVPGELGALPPVVRRHESRCTRLLFAALHPLLDAMKRAIETHGADRVGLVLGSSTGGINVTEAAVAEARRTGDLPPDYDFEDQHAYDALLRSARLVTFAQGPAYVISTACSSGAKAIAAAQRLIDAGVCDAVLTGGVDAICQMTLRGFRSLGIFSNDPCRPFDGTRDGITIGEGSALMLLEREGRALSYVLGAGETADAYHATAPHPEGRGARAAMERALESAGLTPSDVGYVNAHGTGTQKNDHTEALALRGVFGDAPPAYSSTKNRTGHQLAAAGATEALFCIEAMRHGRIPENRRPQAVDDQLAVAPTFEPSPLPAGCRALLSNSFAFGGSNVTLALGSPAHSPSLATASPGPRVVGQTYLTKFACWAPGYPDFESFTRGERHDAERPTAALLPARARGRSSLLTRLFAELLARLDDPAATPLSDLRVVFGSAYGEMTTTLALLEQMLSEGEVSPMRFQASVHNTAAGQISIATENRSFSTTLAAGTETTAMALLEATSHLSLEGGEMAVLLADEDAPRQVLRTKEYPALGVGLRLCFAAEPPPNALAAMTIVRGSVESPATAQEGALETAWAAHPLVDAWGLLRAVHQRQTEAPLGGGWVARLKPMG